MRVLFCSVLFAGLPLFAAEKPNAVPASRLPSCPPDWKLEVVAETPKLIHPSVVCVTPDGRVLMGQDPMDQSPDAQGKPIDSILCFHPDGRVTTWATNLYAVFGLAYLDGKVFVHQYPKLTVFKDAGDVGTDPELLFNTHPKPIGGLNDHIPANLRLAMDGYFYMAVGDKGVYGAVGKDGSKVNLQGGGIIRFRPDGTQLEIYCRGTRNHLDVAINAEDEMFTYDNTDDGNGWWTRVTHMVDGGFYGYPYDYKPRRPYTLWRMDEYGGGSPTGATAYNEDALPAEYRGNLFMCEWGKGSLDRFVVERDGATYKIVKREQFLKGKEDFRPVGIDVTPDGLGFYVTDWNYNGWMNKGRAAGRLLKVTYTGKSSATPKPKWYVPAATAKKFEATTDELIEGLKHPSQRVRLVAQRRIFDAATDPKTTDIARMMKEMEEGKRNGVFHTGPDVGRGKEQIPRLTQLIEDTNAAPLARCGAIWALGAIITDARVRGNGWGITSEATAVLPRALSVNDITVRFQAIREAGTHPDIHALILLQKMLSDTNAAIRFRVATALGRHGNSVVSRWLWESFDDPDFFARYAKFTALNRIGRHDTRPTTWAWDDLHSAFKDENPAIREGALFTVRETYDPRLVKVLADCVTKRVYYGQTPKTRAEVLSILAELHHKRPEWDGRWWGTQPVKGSPPAKTVDWEGTPLVLATVRDALKDASPEVRRAAIEAVEVTRDAEAAGTLTGMFASEPSADIRRGILRSLAGTKSVAANSFVVSLLKDALQHSGDLAEVVSAAEKLGGPEIVSALHNLLKSWNGAAVQADVIRALGTLKAKESVPTLAQFATDSEPLSSVALASLGKIGGKEALDALVPLVSEQDTNLRRNAIAALGTLKNKAAVPVLLNAWTNPVTRTEAITALAQTPDLRALNAYLDGLGDKNATLRDSARKGIEGVRAAALPVLEERMRLASAKPAFTPAQLNGLQGIYRRDDKAVQGPLFANSADAKSTEPGVYEKFALSHSGDWQRGQSIFRNVNGVACIKCHKAEGQGGEVGPDLNSTGAKYSRAQIIEHILYPSRVILDGYQQTVLSLKGDEDSATGIVRGETADELTLVDGEGKSHVVAKKNITARRVSELSPMPEGLQVGLSLQEFSDLVSYVESLKDKPAPPK